VERTRVRAKMIAQAIIITRPEREEMLHQTLARLQFTDWKESPYIQMDTCVSSDPRARQTANVKNALEWVFSPQRSGFRLGFRR
jgi:hypothetical protein